MKKTAIFGLGEAGSLIARDLFAAGVEVRAYDPADVATPEGVIRHENPAAIVRDADMVFALTAAADAVQAMKQALEDIPATAIYADFSTAAAGLKQTLATLAHSAGFAFADVALLAIVPGHGIRATALVSGTGATEFARRMRPFGMPVNEIGDQAGDAATRKLLRSVMMKGLAAVTIEAMRAAQAAGCQDWLWQNLGDEISKANADTLARLVTGSQKHALRRLHEMEASTTLLQELGIDPVMTRCT
ncbi:MAG: DUF1932 domain-containing protein, partial [Pseudohongiellaceae bacterium]